MFNKKLKNKIEELEQRIEELEGQNAFECECVIERDNELKDAYEVISAQGKILEAFAEFIVGLDEKKPSSPKGKKGQKKGKK